MDVGKFGISVFGLDESYIEPIFLVAKIKRTGTTIRSHFKTELNNGDLLEFRCVEIFSESRNDELEAIRPVYFFRINGKDPGYSKRHINFDSARDFYIEEWIPSQNSSTT